MVEQALLKAGDRSEVIAEEQKGDLDKDEGMKYSLNNSEEDCVTRNVRYI